MAKVELLVLSSTAPLTIVEAVVQKAQLNTQSASLVGQASPSPQLSIALKNDPASASTRLLPKKARGSKESLKEVACCKTPAEGPPRQTANTQAQDVLYQGICRVPSPTRSALHHAEANVHEHEHAAANEYPQIVRSFGHAEVGMTQLLNTPFKTLLHLWLDLQQSAVSLLLNVIQPRLDFSLESLYLGGYAFKIL
mmetsp:Transcript_13603/g.23572  ORF Transcript_13603/g.23572 Transcript_13603/m.23572 type:complete len:196 (-) Transcript_13603:99-686(-)